MSVNQNNNISDNEYDVSLYEKYGRKIPSVCVLDSLPMLSELQSKNKK